MSKIKKRLYVRKLIQQQQGVDLNQSIQTIESQVCGNIFQSIKLYIPNKKPLAQIHFSRKYSFQTRDISESLKQSRFLNKFMQPLNGYIAANRIINKSQLFFQYIQKVGDQSASSSSRIRPQESSKDNTKLQFNVVDTLDLLKRMKKTTELIRFNAQLRIKQLNKLKIGEKIIETHNERVQNHSLNKNENENENENKNKNSIYSINENENEDQNQQEILEPSESDDENRNINEQKISDKTHSQLTQQLDNNSKLNISNKSSKELNQSDIDYKFQNNQDQSYDQKLQHKSLQNIQSVDQDIIKSQIQNSQFLFQSNASSFIDQNSVLLDQRLMANKLSLSKNYGYLDDTKIIWLRPKVFIQGDILLFDNISPTDVVQGYLGDCYLLSSLASLAQIKRPIRKLFNTRKYDQRGVYTINFYVDGIKQSILIDDQIPCLDQRPIFAKSNQMIIWAMLIEKAYAKQFGSYQLIESGTSGFAFKDLTGAPYETINNKVGADEIWRQIKTCLNQKFFLAASSIEQKELESQGLDPQGIETSHAYSILDAKQISDQQGQQIKLILLRNPWGKNPWLGTWGPNSNIWDETTEHLKNQQLDDGYFWINHIDFTTYYESFKICKYHSKYKYNYINLFKQDGQVNQFVIKLNFDEDTHSYLCFSQQLVRPYDKDYEYARLSVVILKRKLGSNEYEKFIDQKSQSTKDLFIDINLDKGVYILYVEVFWGQNYQYKQLCLNTYGEKDSNIVELDSNRDYNNYLIDQIIKLHSQQLEKEDIINYMENVFRYQSHVGNYVYFRYVNNNKDYQFNEKVTLKQYDNLVALDTQYYKFSVDLNVNQEKIVKYQLSQNSKGAYKLNYNFKKNLIKIYNTQTLQKDCVDLGQKKQMEISNQMMEVYLYKLSLSNGYAYYFNSDIQKSFKCTLEFELKNLQVKVPRSGAYNIEFTLNQYNKDYLIWLEVINLNEDYETKYSMSMQY